MIGNLLDKWRESALVAQAAGYSGLAEGKCECADELEAALPKWTRITNDPETLPPAGRPIMTIQVSWDGAWYEQNILTPLLTHWMYDKDLPASDRAVGTYWRPLCGIDYPPEQGND